MAGNPFSKDNLVATMAPGVISAGPSVLLGAVLTPELFAISPSLIVLGATYSALRGTQASYVATGKRRRKRKVTEKEEVAEQTRAQEAYLDACLDALTPEDREWFATQIRGTAEYSENNPEESYEIKSKILTTRKLQILGKLAEPTQILGLNGDSKNGYTRTAPRIGRDGCTCTQCRLAAFQENLGVEYEVVNADRTPIRMCEKELEDKKVLETKKEKKAAESSPKELRDLVKQVSTGTVTKYTGERAMTTLTILRNSNQITLSEWNTLFEFVTKGCTLNVHVTKNGRTFVYAE